MCKAKNDKARADFRNVVVAKGGVNCPLCGQFAKVYKRKLNSSMAYGMIKLNRFSEQIGNYDRFHHVGGIMQGFSKTQGGDFAKAAYFGLIEPMKNEDDSKRCSGMWRLTTKGISFVKGMTEVPSHVFVYNGKVEGVTVDLVGIKDALHKRFNYAELMKS